jgi:hypothetical protein
MERIVTVSVLSALLAAWVGCEAGETRRASGPARAVTVEQAPSDELSPELTAILRQGPGGPVLDDGIDLDSDSPLALRIVLEP